MTKSYRTDNYCEFGTVLSGRSGLIPSNNLYDSSECCYKYASEWHTKLFSTLLIYFSHLVNIRITGIRNKHLS